MEGYLNTAESSSIALDVKGDSTKNEETIEVLRKHMVERNQGLQLYISYVDRGGDEIVYNRAGINTYSIERIKLDQDCENARIKEKWEHVSTGIQQTQNRELFRGEIMTTGGRGQGGQGRGRKKQTKRVPLSFLALWLAVQLGKCVYREEKQRLGYAHAVEQYMNRRYRRSEDRFHFFLENEERPNGMNTVESYSEKFPDEAGYCYHPIEQDYWWDEDDTHYRDSYMCLWYQKKTRETCEPFFDEALGKGQYTISDGAMLMPNWQDYGPETELGEYLNTAEGPSTTLDVKSDFAESEEVIETLRRCVVKHNWGLRLCICYLDRDGNEIAYDRAGINTHSIERAKLGQDYKGAEMKERQERAGKTAERGRTTQSCRVAGSYL